MGLVWSQVSFLFFFFFSNAPVAFFSFSNAPVAFSLFFVLFRNEVLRKFYGKCVKKRGKKDFCFVFARIFHWLMTKHCKFSGSTQPIKILGSHHLRKIFHPRFYF